MINNQYICWLCPFSDLGCFHYLLFVLFKIDFFIKEDFKHTSKGAWCHDTV